MSSAAYHNYYSRQCGGALPHYAGAAYQRGHGIGSFLKGALRSATSTLLPVIKDVGKGLLSDVASGKSLKSSLKSRALQAGKEVSHRLVDSAISGISRKAGLKRQAPQAHHRPAKSRKGSRRKRAGRKGDIFD